MYHKDGISLHLQAAGEPITEWEYPTDQDPTIKDWHDTRAIISEKTHAPFSIILEFTKDFRPFSAEALKLTVAIGHHHQTPGDLVDVQAWHIPLDQISTNKFAISEQWCWVDDSSEALISEIRIPAPEGRSTDPFTHVATY